MTVITATSRTADPAVGELLAEQKPQPISELLWWQLLPIAVNRTPFAVTSFNDVDGCTSCK